MEIRLDVYPENEILEVEGFENKGNLNGTNIPLYIHKNAYDFLPEKPNIDCSGLLLKRLFISNFTPVRFGRC